jgi:outer membrane protein assembly factor BamB
MVIFSGLDKGTTAVKPTEKGDTWSAEQIWHNAEISMYMSSPVLSDSLLFGLDHKHKGRFFCLNARTGSTLWTSEGRQTRNAAILDAGEVLFFLTTDAELIVAKKGAVEFEPIARYTVADSPTWAHPVILGKRILIKDLSTLALLSLK